MATTQLTTGVDHFRLGLLFAVGSAFAFGMSGPFAKSLMEAGWSPTAAVTARLAGGALVMAVFATIVKPDWFREAAAAPQDRGRLRHLIPIAGAQLCYYNAVAHLSVGVALLLEYTAPDPGGRLAVGHHPAPAEHLTLAGVALAIAGIMLVLNVFAGAHINADRRGWGLGRRRLRGLLLHDVRRSQRRRRRGLNSITLADGRTDRRCGRRRRRSGVVGVMPLTFTTNDAVVAGLTTSWLVPVIALALITTAIAYTLGIMGIARLRPRFASLVGLSEVMFAVLAAWVLLGEAITLTQAIGGVVVLAGLALARQGDRSEKLAKRHLA